MKNNKTFKILKLEKNGKEVYYTGRSKKVYGKGWQCIYVNEISKIPSSGRFYYKNRFGRDGGGLGYYDSRAISIKTAIKCLKDKENYPDISSIEVLDVTEIPARYILA
jgi:hypothetical protein